MGQLKPWTAAALAVLEDGRWHAREDVITVAARVVPPGVAYRTGEANRNDPNRRPNGPGPRTRGDDSTSISYGARKIIDRNLGSLTRRSRLERATVDGVDCLRLAPAQSKAS